MAIQSPPDVLPAPGSTPEAEPLFAPRFLAGSRASDYFALIAGTRPGAGSGFRIFEPQSFAAPPYPLELCEFLAYKSVLAYETAGTIESHLAKGCHGYVEGSFKFFDSSPTKGDTQGYGFVVDDTAFIVMRGSSSFQDWIDDFTARLTDKETDLLTLRAIGGAEPARHLGFARAWSNVVAEIDTWVDGLRARAPAARVEQCCFAGHSLGGALALVGAHDFARRGRLPIAAVVTFAAPKVGEAAFAADYARYPDLASRTLRLESNEDLVPMAALSYGAQSPGPVCLIDKRPMIGGWEKLAAGLLFIAGWEKGKPTPQQPKSEQPKPAADEAPPPKPSGAATESGKPAATPAKPASDVDARTALLWFAAFAVTVLAAIVARKAIIRFRAHGVGKRYALYLTTLSYQHIRAARAAAPDSLDPFGNKTDKYYDDAYATLQQHLRFIRGGDEQAFRKLRNRPIRVTARNAGLLEERSKEAYRDYIF